MEHLLRDLVHDHSHAVTPRALVVRLEVRIILASEAFGGQGVELLEELGRQLQSAFVHSLVDEVQRIDVVDQFDLRLSVGRQRAAGSTLGGDHRELVAFDQVRVVDGADPCGRAQLVGDRRQNARRADYSKRGGDAHQQPGRFRGVAPVVG